MSSTRLTPRLALLMTLPPLLWAGNAVVGRLMVGHVPPLALNALRWLIAALLLAPLATRVWRDAAAIRQSWVYLLALGTLGVGSFNALQYLALETSTPLNVTLINASMPLWMLAVGALGYGERPAPRQLLGAALSLLGVATVVSRGAWSARRRPAATDFRLLDPRSGAEGLSRHHEMPAAAWTDTQPRPRPAPWNTELEDK